MYTEHLTQRYGIGAPAHAQQLTTNTTLNSGGIDMQYFRRAFFLFDTGAWGGTSPTLSATLQIQESPDNSTWTNNATVGSITISAASNVGTLEIRAGQLGSGKRYVRLQAVCAVGGTSPTVPVAVLGWGDEADHTPGNVKNVASVVQQQVVT